MDADRVLAAKAALDVLGDADVEACDRAGLDDVLRHCRTVRGLIDAVEVRVARRSRHLAAEGRSECPEGVLVEHGRRSGRDARAAAEREQACTQMPTFEDALAAGTVSSGHVDALAAATNGLDDDAKATIAGHADTLLDHATKHSVEDFGRECRELARAVSGDEGESRLARQRRQRRVRQWVDGVTGMHHIHAELDPEAGAKVASALDAATRALRHAANSEPQPAPDTSEEGAEDTSAAAIAARLRAACGGAGPTWEQLAADALVELITGARTVDPRVPEVAIHIDWITLRDGLQDRSLCETADGTLLPPSTVRRLCCEARIFPVVVNGAGEILDQGRSQRLANRAQRRALRAMYRTCGHPHCTVAFDRCEIHHVDPWERLGPTDLDNLLPLCSFHHHLVHEGGWTLTLAPQRVITLTRPDGTRYFHGSTIDRLPPPPAAAAEAEVPADHPPGRRRSAA